MSLPRLPSRRRRVGEVWGVSMVRDEEDVLPTTLQHLLDQGLDRLLIADNLSQDRTSEILRRFADSDPRVLLATDTLDAYHQDHKMTLLARFASRSGADWVVPFDADEIWFAEQGTVGDHLRTLGRQIDAVGTVAAPLHDTIPLAAVGTAWNSGDFIVNATPATWGKIAVRAHPTVRIDFGNHGAARVGEVRAGLRIAHLVYRGPEQLARKVRRGDAALSLTSLSTEVGTHWRTLSKLSDDQVADLWHDVQAGISHPEISINVGGPMVRCRPLDWESWDPEGALATGDEDKA